MFNLKAFLGLGYYTSPLDEFLNEYNRTHPKQSASVQAEIKKSRRIAELRDKVTPPSDQSTLWDQF